jgi:hypothetical protein
MNIETPLHTDHQLAGQLRIAGFDLVSSQGPDRTTATVTPATPTAPASIRKPP